MLLLLLELATLLASVDGTFSIVATDSDTRQVGGGVAAAFAVIICSMLLIV